MPTFSVPPPSSKPPPPPADAPRILVIGAGSRGCAYAGSIVYPPHNIPAEDIVRGIIVGVAEPDDGKRRRFLERCLLYTDKGLEFSDWREMVTEEGKRRVAEVGVDGIFICE